MEPRNIIEISGLSKYYDGVCAVRNLNLSIREGEVFGLLGPNGAGKTTTTLMLLGLTDPSAGSASIAGHDCTRDALAVKKLVGYLPDNVGFYPNLSGRENLIFSGQMNGLSAAEARSRAESLLKRVGIAYAAERKAGAYSRGMRQRLGIADVLMKDPRVIIMDEPTIGIDPVGIRELTSLIRELSVQDGRTILISSHELYQIQEISDRVGIFVQGSLIACGRIDELGQQLQSEGLYMVDIELDNPDEALLPALRAMEHIRAVGRMQDRRFHIESRRDIRAQLMRVLADGGYVLSELHEKGGNLEEIYRKYFEKAGENNEQSGNRDNERKKTLAGRLGRMYQRKPERVGQN